jgi:Ca-activated chloride channel homolog
MQRHLILAALTTVLGATAVATQGPGLAITMPTAETVVTGTTVFGIDSPPGSSVRDVVFFVDGLRACVATRPPWQCEWDAGPRVTSRHVRAVARLADGAQLTAALRTKALDIGQHTSVDAVVVSAHVKDSRDRFVTGLSVADFRLFEDGRPQVVSSVSAEDAGADIVLTLDISGSMAPVMDELKASARRFIAAMRPQDRLTLAGFNSGLFVISSAAAEPAARLAQLDRVRAFGRTSLYDSLVRAADLFKTSQGRRALVVFTDGDDVSSRGSAETARAALQAKDIVLYVAGQGRAAEDDDLRDRLRRLAEETGGAAYFAAKMSALDEHFADVLQTIGHQYVLTYSPDRPLGDGAWRAIKVETTARGRLDVRARQGYFARRASEQ